MFYGHTTLSTQMTESLNELWKK